MAPWALSRRELLKCAAGGIALVHGPMTWSAPRGVEESGFVSIGGIEQWVGINGEDTGNPAILYLHGGPGEAQSPLLRLFASWSHEFTIVNWDQRGSGRTYGKNGPATPGMSTPEMALDRLATDAHEVALYACHRLSKKKVVLVGQSWGALLGLHVIKLWPELFSAFVATGLAASWKDALESQERWARAQATAAGDRATLEALDAAAGLPVTDLKRVMAPRAYVMGPSDLAYLKLQGELIGLSQSQPPQGEGADWLAGGQFTREKLLPVVLSFDARQLGLDMPVPFFAIQGRDDHVGSLESAKAYVADVRTHTKALIPITGGHFACFTSAAEFVAALHSHVLPLARRAG
jgi:pimeloyl-ACP methyl ester carboxylesterase